MQQLMKSMREATMSSGMLDNSGTQLGTEMLDTQYANKMSGLPGGLAAAIARQLERQLGSGAAAALAAPAAAGAAGAATGAAASSPEATPLSSRQIDFIRTHQDAARAAEAVSGIPAAFTVAQAAHESGWGQREIRNADGTSSHNLFGIKAGAGWNGPVAEITTTEYVGGEAQKVTAKFRSYASYGESFRDYAQADEGEPALRRRRRPGGAGAGERRVGAGLRARPAARRLRHRSRPMPTSSARLINTTLRMQQHDADRPPMSISLCSSASARGR